MEVGQQVARFSKYTDQMIVGFLRFGIGSFLQPNISPCTPLLSDLWRSCCCCELALYHIFYSIWHVQLVHNIVKKYLLSTFLYTPTSIKLVVFKVYISRKMSWIQSASISTQVAFSEAKTYWLTSNVWMDETNVLAIINGESCVWYIGPFQKMVIKKIPVSYSCNNANSSNQYKLTVP